MELLICSKRVYRETYHPEHGGCEGKELVAQLIERSVLVIVGLDAQSNQSNDEGDYDQCVEGTVENSPEAYCPISDFPDFEGFIDDKADGEDVLDETVSLSIDPVGAVADKAGHSRGRLRQCLCRRRG